MSPHEENESIAFWQGKVEGKLEAQGGRIDGLQVSMDRIESKVNALKNSQERQSGGFRVGALVGGFAASGVLLIFGAFVTKVVGA